MIKARKKRVGCPHCDRVFVDHGDVHKHIRGKHGAKKGHAYRKGVIEPMKAAARVNRSVAERRKFGTLGAASAVRHIDPSEYMTPERLAELKEEMGDGSDRSWS